MNKTQNTLENKAKFMALYWGQKVMRSSINDKDFTDLLITTIIPETMKDNWFLELTPLSKITDEDLKHLSKIDLVSSGEYDDSVTDLDLIEFGQYEFLNSERDLKYLLPEAVDFIRSKGYALPWMDLSVEDLVSYGWVKIKS